MGTTLRITLAASDRVGGIRLIDTLFADVRRLEGMLSTWQDDSEIMALNRAEPGRPVPLSAELAGLLVEAADWSRETDGAFDPAIGALVETWDLRGNGRVPTEEERARALGASGLARFHLTPSRGARLDDAAWLDTGGFGKGAALRSAARLLREHGVHDALLNFGGQVLAVGHDERGEPWAIPVAHPIRRTEPVLALRVTGRSVSTSSQSERTITVGGRRLGHVLDPRTGMPVAPWGSVTVVAEDPLAADVLSTALLVLGPDAALRWSESREDIAVLILEERDGRPAPRWNRAMEPYLAPGASSFTGG